MYISGLLVLNLSIFKLRISFTFTNDLYLYWNDLHVTEVQFSKSGDEINCHILLCGYEKAACIHANGSLPSVVLHRRYPVMWQGHLTLKNDLAAVQLHFLSGNVNLAKLSLPQQSDQRTPALRISQRMRLEQTQLEGVDRRMQVCVYVQRGVYAFVHMHVTCTCEWMGRIYWHTIIAESAMVLA